MLIFLVGYMGCGKSTIGRKLAHSLNMPLVDMDALVEQNCAESISAIFVREGEDGFRRHEKKTLEHITRQSHAVIATGGGAPCFFDNMEVMNRSGITVYLKMSPEKLAVRLERGKAHRPLIRDKTPEELIAFIRSGIAQREDYYLKSKLIIDCDGVSDSYISFHIAQYLQETINPIVL